VISIQETARGTTLSLRVQPRAKRNAIVGEVGGALKVAVTAPPLEGRANAACTELLAELLNLPRSALTIISGQNSRNKVVLVEGLAADQLRSRLDSQLLSISSKRA